MKVSELKEAVESAGHDQYFFTRETMQFFGDTMGNYGIRDAGSIRRADGSTCEAWELYRRHAVKHGLCGSAYFDKATFRRVFPE